MVGHLRCPVIIALLGSRPHARSMFLCRPIPVRKMKRSTKLSGALTIALLTMVVASASADEQLRTRLIGYEETPLTINSPARGDFRATIGAGGAVSSMS